jgi:hypothetical protein
MAEYEQTVPNPTLQDVVLMDFACNPPNQVDLMKAPLTCPNKGHPGLSAFEQAWADQPSFLPTIIQVGKMGAQSQWWQGKKLAAVVGSGLPKGMMPGRVAAIGFSEGCSGIKQLLSNYTDADQIDFVYACDGMAGQVDASGAVYTQSIEPWVNFALRAAQGKTMMVVTHTEIIPANRKCPPPAGFSQCGVASTTESAKALMAEVKKRIGYKQVAPRMVPRGLIGQSEFAPTPPNGESWSSWVNSPSQPAKVVSSWPSMVNGDYEIMGNLIRVGFHAQTQGDPSPPSSSQSAHIFQAWWVMRQVIMEVLACRWAAKCDSVEINTDTAASLGATSIRRDVYVDRRFPSVIQRPHPAMLRRVGRASLGALGEGCLVEGNFSRFSAADLRSGFSSTLSTASPTELAVGALGLTVGGIALYKYLTR